MPSLYCPTPWTTASAATTSTTDGFWVQSNTNALAGTIWCRVLPAGRIITSVVTTSSTVATMAAPTTIRYVRYIPSPAEQWDVIAEYDAANDDAIRRSIEQDQQRTAFRRARRQQAPPLRSHADDAKKRAHDLLLEHLTPAQRETFEAHKWFVIEGGKSKTKYRIRAAGHLVANIDVMDGRTVKRRLCGHCDPQAMPLGDHLLAQKMMLELAEDDFLRIANRHAA